MKKLFLIIGLAIATCFQVDAQVIQLVPDETYGAVNNWDKIFDTYYDTLMGQPYGLRKQLVLFDDGKAIVSHATRNRYSLFDANGKPTAPIYEGFTSIATNGLLHNAALDCLKK